MALDICRRAEPSALVNTVALAWTGWIRTRPAGAMSSSIAFGGGRVFRRFLETAAGVLRDQPSTLDRLEFFWGDERCVPPDDAESNYRLAHESFFAPLGIPAGRIHRLRGEADPEDAARAAEVVLRVATGTGPTAMPRLDLVFLGLGEDGHVASLFPGAPAAVTESTAVYLPVVGPKPPPQRLTLSYAAIAAAREVWVIASGVGKEEAMRESLRTGGRTPFARVLRERAQTRLFTDIPG